MNLPHRRFHAIYQAIVIVRGRLMGRNASAVWKLQAKIRFAKLFAQFHAPLDREGSRIQIAPFWHESLCAVRRLSRLPSVCGVICSQGDRSRWLVSGEDFVRVVNAAMDSCFAFGFKFCTCFVGSLPHHGGFQSAQKLESNLR